MIEGNAQSAFDAAKGDLRLNYTHRGRTVLRVSGGGRPELTLLLTLGVFAINLVRNQPALESFLFALALAVGLTPQLLPAIVSVNLSRGAVEMATKKVITKRLSAIENLGSMDVLCSDKTGTLTLGVVRLHEACECQGVASPDVLRYAQLTATLQT